MQAAPFVRATAALPVPSLTIASVAIPSIAVPSITGALRAVESLLLGGGQRTARRNAWAAVLEDKRRARDRHEAQHVLEAVAPRSPRAT